jgi:hypothetical protein
MLQEEIKKRKKRHRNDEENRGKGHRERRREKGNRKQRKRMLRKMTECERENGIFQNGRRKDEATVCV